MQGVDLHKERTWAEVDLGAIGHNYRQAVRLAQGCEAIPVIKANAYGHGDIPVAKALLAEGATRFAVATAGEALRLRKAGILEPVLVLGVVQPACVAELAAADVEVCCASLEDAQEYAAAMAPARHRYTLGVHVKLNTGMARLGLGAEVPKEDIGAIDALEGIAVHALFTHLAAADVAEEDEFTKVQTAQFFLRAERVFAVLGRSVPLHVANSASILRHVQRGVDFVRPGIMLYGYAPGPDAETTPLLPALAWKARIAQVRVLKKGGAVGYGLAWTAERTSRIATVCVGYADGLHRAASNKMKMLVKGRPVPQVGRICMDMCMLDVTDVPGVQAGDVATIIGTDGKCTLSADALADAAGTISYEVLCAISGRVPRVYTGGVRD